MTHYPINTRNFAQWGTPRFLLFIPSIQHLLCTPKITGLTDYTPFLGSIFSIPKYIYVFLLHIVRSVQYNFPSPEYLGPPPPPNTPIKWSLPDQITYFKSYTNINKFQHYENTPLQFQMFFIAVKMKIS